MILDQAIKESATGYVRIKAWCPTCKVTLDDATRYQDSEDWEPWTEVHESNARFVTQFIENNVPQIKTCCE